MRDDGTKTFASGLSKFLGDRWEGNDEIYNGCISLAEVSPNSALALLIEAIEKASKKWSDDWRRYFADSPSGLFRAVRDILPKCTDQALLAKMALDRDDFEICEIAVKNLTDQVLLTRIAVETKYPAIRATVMMNLHDQFQLAKVAVEARERSIKEAAVKRLSDQRALAMVAARATDDEVREVAMQKVSGEALLGELGGDVESFLLKAAGRDLRLLYLLLNARSDLVSCRNARGETPLHRAVSSAHNEAVKLLLTKHCDVNAQDADGFTPLHSANSVAIAELLLASKADVNAKDNIGRTPLHLAAEHNRLKVVELLLANKADVNAKDNIGRTPLHLAAEHDRMKVVELLLAKDVDMNAEDKDHNTPLHRAAVNRHRGTAELLLANNAEIRILDSTIKPFIETKIQLRGNMICIKVRCASARDFCLFCNKNYIFEERQSVLVRPGRDYGTFSDGSVREDRPIWGEEHFLWTKTGQLADVVVWAKECIELKGFESNPEFVEFCRLCCAASLKHAVYMEEEIIGTFEDFRSRFHTDYKKLDT